LAQRKVALQGFKSGEFRVLVATDIAARGIDVKGISVVINYDLPDNPDDYVHRIGRTGRAGAKGRAITLATPEQNKDVWDIEKVIRAEIPLADESPLPFVRRKASAPSGPRSKGGSRPQAGSHSPGGSQGGSRRFRGRRPAGRS
jgi:ATP-dependent RNA helicase RhlE